MLHRKECTPFTSSLFCMPPAEVGRGEDQGTPLKPRQGPCPWTPLLNKMPSTILIANEKTALVILQLKATPIILQHENLFLDRITIITKRDLSSNSLHGLSTFNF